MDSSDQMLHSLLGYILSTYASVNTFYSALRCGSKLRIRDIRDILAGVFFSCSTILFSLCFINFRNLPAYSSLLGLFISISLLASTTSLSLALRYLSNSSGVKHLPLRVNPSILVWNTRARHSILGEFM
jgi:hypothetical protein